MDRNKYGWSFKDYNFICALTLGHKALFIASYYSWITTGSSKSDYLKVNFIRNIFENWTQQITGNVDLLMIMETKLDSSIQEGQFLIPGYSASYGTD